MLNALTCPDRGPEKYGADRSWLSKKYLIASQKHPF